MSVYKPYADRTPDSQYHDLLRRIVSEGEWVDPKQEEPAQMVLGHLMRFPLANGFPLITERDLLSAPSQFSMAIGELCAFLNGAQTLEEMKKFGVGWWSRWVTAEKCAKRGLPAGDLGPGSYGAAWRRFPTADGKPFDQITALLEQIEELPHLRTLEITPWIPQYIPRGRNRVQKVVVVPCHGWVHVHINTRTRQMILEHRQRSADTPVGLVFNLIQYAALLLMLSQVSGYEPKEVVYHITDAHIFQKQMGAVAELLATEPQKLPTVEVEPSVKNLFDFRPEHFKVTDYYPKLPRMQIWTPI